MARYYIKAGSLVQPVLYDFVNNSIANPKSLVNVRTIIDWYCDDTQIREFIREGDSDFYRDKIGSMFRVVLLKKSRYDEGYNAFTIEKEDLVEVRSDHDQ